MISICKYYLLFTVTLKNYEIADLQQPNKKHTIYHIRNILIKTTSILIPPNHYPTKPY